MVRVWAFRCAGALSLNNTTSGMKTTRELTAIIEREGNGYVSLCPELDVASQGDTIEEARQPGGGAGVVLRGCLTDGIAGAVAR